MAESSERQRLAERIEVSSEPSHMLLLASDDNAEPPVAMVSRIVWQGEKDEEYSEWRRKDDRGAGALPGGYLATEFFKPHWYVPE